MPAVKTFDRRDGHLYSGSQLSREEAFDTIRFMRNEYDHESYYIGEKNVVEVDPEKLKCRVCKKMLEKGLGRRL